jgi:hypothetical protein
MKKIKSMKKNILLPLSIVLMVGCNQKSNTKTPEQETVIQEENHHHTDESIVLNNGKKWKVVESMAVYIRNMENAVNNFDGKDYTSLAENIDKNIRALTENCTMEGQAHDELHKWLVPFIELSEDFDVATEKEEQEKIYREFKNAFIEFNTYFE